MRRRDFLKTSAVIAAGSMVPAYQRGNAEVRQQPSSQAGEKTNAGSLHHVHPMIGTGWHGHMFPGAVAPFGMVQLSPDTSGAPEPKWNEKWDIYDWDHCSGYHYPDNFVLGFSHTHLQGTGASDLGDVLLMPLVQDRNWGWESGEPGQESEAQIEAIGVDSGWVFNDAERGYRSSFSHEREKARPGYYAVHLDTPDVFAELTATTRCGMHRYSYPSLPTEKHRGLILDLVHGIGCEAYAAELHIESNVRVTGSRSTKGWAVDKQVYFVVEFSRPFASVEAKSRWRLACRLGR